MIFFSKPALAYSIAVIGDERASGKNLFWLNETTKVGSWVTGSHRNSLARLAGFDETINKAGNTPLVFQALAISGLKPDVVVIEYGQNELCKGEQTNIEETIRAINILQTSLILLMPAPHLESIAKLQRNSTFCTYRCPAADDNEADLINLALENLQSQTVRFVDFEGVYKEDYNQFDCINPSLQGGEAKALAVNSIKRKTKADKNGK
jgi:hypothetical protein